MHNVKTSCALQELYIRRFIKTFSDARQDHDCKRILRVRLITRYDAMISGA